MNYEAWRNHHLPAALRGWPEADLGQVRRWGLAAVWARDHAVEGVTPPACVVALPPDEWTAVAMWGHADLCLQACQALDRDWVARHGEEGV